MVNNFAHQSDCWGTTVARVCSMCGLNMPRVGDGGLLARGCFCSWVVDARVSMKMITLHGDDQVETEVLLDPAQLMAGQRFVLIDGDLALEYEVFDFNQERNVVLVYQLSPVDTRPASASLADRLDPKQDKGAW
jgi:hypothetical protein